MNRKSILKVSIRQIKAARALLSWSQEELAEAAGVSTPTIKRLEARDGPIGGRTNTATKIRTALEEGGVEFLDEMFAATSPARATPTSAAAPARLMPDKHAGRA